MASKKFNTEYYAFLAKRIREHDKNAFTELYDITHDNLYKYISYFLKNEHLAQDALQEVYILVFKNISMLKSDKLLYSWLRQITYHVCCDFARKNRAITSHESSGISEDLMMAQIRSEADEFQDIWDQDLSSHLHHWLDELPTHTRQAFVLRYENLLKMEEIADFMDCSLSSVKRYLNSAREHLRKRLEEYRC